ncbi:hypothetical protein B4113_2237 [Geobacillus sp. B4113_201601]|nr:hypothetical protein B4113_2237 [Geobacillus sp. B4113_201601]
MAFPPLRVLPLSIPLLFAARWKGGQQKKRFSSFGKRTEKRSAVPPFLAHKAPTSGL